MTRDMSCRSHGHHPTAISGCSERSNGNGVNSISQSSQKQGRIGRQGSSGYNRRSLIETAVYRYKTITGSRLTPGPPLRQWAETQKQCFLSIS
jgi:hypothetical protein